jgi:hypothetical protein
MQDTQTGTVYMYSTSSQTIPHLRIKNRAPPHQPLEQARFTVWLYRCPFSYPHPPPLRTCDECGADVFFTRALKVFFVMKKSHAHVLGVVVLLFLWRWNRVDHDLV